MAAMSSGFMFFIMSAATLAISGVMPPGGSPAAPAPAPGPMPILAAISCERCMEARRSVYGSICMPQRPVRAYLSSSH